MVLKAIYTGGVHVLSQVSSSLENSVVAVICPGDLPGRRAFRRLPSQSFPDRAFSRTFSTRLACAFPSSLGAGWHQSPVSTLPAAVLQGGVLTAHQGLHACLHTQTHWHSHCTPDLSSSDLACADLPGVAPHPAPALTRCVARPCERAGACGWLGLSPLVREAPSGALLC